MAHSTCSATSLLLIVDQHSITNEVQNVAIQLRMHVQLLSEDLGLFQSESPACCTPVDAMEFYIYSPAVADSALANVRSPSINHYKS